MAPSPLHSRSAARSHACARFLPAALASLTAVALLAGPATTQGDARAFGTTPGAGALNTGAPPGAPLGWYLTALNTPVTGGVVPGVVLTDPVTMQPRPYNVEFELGFATASEAVFGLTGASPPANTAFRFQGGAVFTPRALETPLPVVFGMVSGVGDADGGEARQLVGANFQAPGAGATTVTLDGSGPPIPVTSLQVVSNVEIALTTPPGLTAAGNPTGLNDVVVENALTLALADAPPRASEFVYRPALLRDTPLQRGRRAELRFHAKPGSLALLFVGVPSPVPFPLTPPDEGSVLLDPGSLLLLGTAPVGTGVLDLSEILAPIPSNPNLVSAALQGVVLDLAAFNLSLTDLTTVRIDP